MEYIHYGHSKFDPKRWNDVRGSEGGFFNKPDGGLWASPVDAEFGWLAWCTRERFNEQALKRSFRFKIAPEARMLELTPDNVWELPTTPEYEARFGVRNRELYSSVRGIDFEKLAEDYDVIEYRVSEYPELYRSLYGWDCDCILVLNKEVIVFG